GERSKAVLIAISSIGEATWVRGAPRFRRSLTSPALRAPAHIDLVSRFPSVKGLAGPAALPSRKAEKPVRRFRNARTGHVSIAYPTVFEQLFVFLAVLTGECQKILLWLLKRRERQIRSNARD